MTAVCDTGVKGGTKRLKGVVERGEKAMFAILPRSLGEVTDNAGFRCGTVLCTVALDLVSKCGMDKSFFETSLTLLSRGHVLIGVT